jgi:toxin CcdB
MAQFDVHRNGGQNRQEIPFLVVVQSRRFDAAQTRVVAALRLGKGVSARLTPDFEIEDITVYLDPLQIASIRLATLGQPIDSLADDANSDRIVAALDEILSRA